MKKAILFLVAGILFSCNRQSEEQLLLTNPSDQPRTDAGVVIPRTLLEAFKPVQDGLVPLLHVSGTLLPAQVDDLDGDGAWDELFVLLNIGAKETVAATVTFTAPEDYPRFSPRTNIRFARKDMDYKEVTTGTRESHATNTITQEVWQMEGIAWENDRIGFRNYFDQRNGMDIFGKVTNEMVLDEVGYKDNPGYHYYNPEWGVDVLKVGNSLGAGSIAFSYNDSLYRLGDNGPATCTIIREGPLRSMFRFTFENWKMGDQVLDVIHDVSIQAGTYYYESKVSYTGTGENPDLVTGIVNMKSNALVEVPGTKNARAYHTFDLQSEDTTLLGMAVMVPAKSFRKTSEAPEAGDGIIQTYCIHLETAPEKVSTFRFYAVWERENEQWKTADGFERMLTREAALMLEPVKVKVAGS
jgi:hypothetical protein